MIIFTSFLTVLSFLTNDILSFFLFHKNEIFIKTLRKLQIATQTKDLHKPGKKKIKTQKQLNLAASQQHPKLQRRMMLI